MWYISSIYNDGIEMLNSYDCDADTFEFILSELGTNKKIRGKFSDIVKYKPLGLVKSDYIGMSLYFSSRDFRDFTWCAVRISNEAAGLVKYIKDINFTDIIAPNDIALELNPIKSINELYYVEDSFGVIISCILEELIDKIHLIDLDIIRRNIGFGYFQIYMGNDVRSLEVKYKPELVRYLTKVITLKKGK